MSNRKLANRLASGCCRSRWRTFFAAIVVIVVAMLSQLNVRADDWPQWLGPARQPIWGETGVLERFPRGGPTLRWETEIGSGYSGPAVAGGRVFVMDRAMEGSDLHAGELLHEGDVPTNTNFVRRLLPGRERVVCLDESSGKIRWVHEYDCPYTTVATYAIGPRCTPTVDGDLVYSLGAEGELRCLRVADGTRVWSRDLRVDYGLNVPNWGLASHPLVDDGHLICIVGGDGTGCVAFDKRTGNELWRSLSPTEPGYCPPVIYNVGRERHLIVWHGDSVNGLDPATGSVYWSVPFAATFAMAIGTPQISGRDLFLMSFNRKSAVIRIAEDQRAARILWTGDTRRGVAGVLNTAIIREGYVYACGHGGRYSCVDLETGERQWSTFEPSTGGRPAAWSNVFTVRNHDRYFHANDLGDLIIARMSPDGYEEVSRAHLIDPTHDVAGRRLVWSHPAFANRNVYLRNDKVIKSYSLASE